MRSTATALFVALFAAIALFAAPGESRAQSDDQAFTISGVEVDVTAASAMEARDKAFTKVQQLAFRRLMDRLIAEGGGKVGQPTGRALESLVRDVIVESERSSSVRYIASFTVRFKPDAVRTLLAQEGTNFVDDRRAPMVVVPVLVGPTGPILWDDPNPWREAWAKRPGDGLVPFIVPMGELEDVTTVSAAQAVAHNSPALTALAQRHNALDVVVAVARFREGSEGGRVVEVQTFGVGPAVPPAGRFEVAAAGRESQVALLGRAADLIAADIQTRHKSAAALPADGILAPVSALVPLSGMADWMSVRRRLAALPQIHRLDVLSLSRKEAALILHTGAPEQLETALHQAGFGLDTLNPIWTILPSPDSPIPGPARPDLFPALATPGPGPNPAPAGQVLTLPGVATPGADNVFR